MARKASAAAQASGPLASLREDVGFLVPLFQMAGEHDMAEGRAADAPLRKRIARAAEIGIGRGIELNALADGKEIQVSVIDALAGAHRDRHDVNVSLGRRPAQYRDKHKYNQPKQ